MLPVAFGQCIQHAYDAIVSDETLLRDKSVITSHGSSSRPPSDLEQWIHSRPDQRIISQLKGVRLIPLEIFVQKTVHDKAMIEHIKRLKGEAAQVVLDYLQSWIDHCCPSDPDRRRVLYLLVKLSFLSDIIPKPVQMSNIDMPEKDTWRSSYCDVYRGTWKNDRGVFDVVLKKCRKTSEQEYQGRLKGFKKEAFVWRQLRHPNIYPFLGLYTEPDPSARLFAVSTFTRFENLELFMNPQPHESYKLVVHEHERYNPDKDRERLLWEIAEGLAFMHSQAIVHVDLKLANIFIDQERHACISDFGSGIIGGETTGKLTEDHSLGMSRRWIPPEHMLYLNAQNGLSGTIQPRPRPNWTFDVYAFGCICSTLCQRTAVVYPEFSDDTFKEAIKVRPTRSSKDTSDILWHFIIGPCRDPDPVNRPIMDAICRLLAREAGRLPDGRPFLFQARTAYQVVAERRDELSFGPGEKLYIKSTSPKICPSGCDPSSSSAQFKCCQWASWHKSPRGWLLASTRDGRTGMTSLNYLLDPVMFKARAIATFQQGLHPITSPLLYSVDDVVEILAIGDTYQTWHAMDSNGETGEVWSGSLEILVTQTEGVSQQSYRTRHFDAPPNLLEPEARGVSFEQDQVVRAVQKPNFETDWMVGQLEGSDDVRIFPISMINPEPCH